MASIENENKIRNYVEAYIYLKFVILKIYFMCSFDNRKKQNLEKNKISIYHKTINSYYDIFINKFDLKFSHIYNTQPAA